MQMKKRYEAPVTERTQTNMSQMIAVSTYPAPAYGWQGNGWISEGGGSSTYGGGGIGVGGDDDTIDGDEMYARQFSFNVWED